MRNWTQYLREKLSLPSMRDHRDERAIREMADHLEDIYTEALARGASKEDAERLAESWLGDHHQNSKEIGGVEPHPLRARSGRWVEKREEALRARARFRAALAEVLKDLRMGLRGLARHPLFTGVVVLVLALGIGTTVSIFTLVNAVVLSPLPFPEPDRLVSVRHSAAAWGLEDAGQCAAWHFTYEEESQVFEALGMFGRSSVPVTGEGPPESVPALQVTEGVLRALGVTPAVGRLFLQEDMDPNGPLRVMLGHGYWKSRFGGDPSVVGRLLEVDGQAAEIVGVAPHEVRTLGLEPSLLLPFRFDRSTLFVGNIGYGAVGRLKEGASVEAAEAELNRLLPLAWEKFPGGPVAGSSPPDQFSAGVFPLREDLVGSVGGLLWVLMTGVGIVLLIACANVANLFLVRAEGKAGEMAIRLAMGASRRRIGWEYLKESLLLGLLGGAAGLLVARVGLGTLLALAPADLPRLAEVSFHGRVLIFTLLVSLGSGLALGLLPVVKHARGSLVDYLKEAGRGGAIGRRGYRFRNLLAVSQVALALIVLVAAGLMLQTFQTMRAADPGFRDPEGILALRLHVAGHEVSDLGEVARIFEAMVQRIAEVPGVSAVGLATAIPMDGSENFNPFYVHRRDTGIERPTGSTRHKWVGEGYLEALGIDLVAGRAITWSDIHVRAPVAMLSETLAREAFGSPEAAIGQAVAARPDPPVWKEVVGVVKDVREDGMDQAPPPLVYWPLVTLGFWEGSSTDQIQVYRSAGFAVRSHRVGTVGFREDLERGIWEFTPNTPLLQVRTMPDMMARSMARTSFTLILLSLAGAVALILCLVGVYGVISHAVGQRTRELGMRMALGADRGQVVALVVREGALLAGTGVAMGLLLAFAMTRHMSGLLFGVSPVEPITFAAAATGLLGSALLASYIPASRAAKVDPAVALRAD